MSKSPEWKETTLGQYLTQIMEPIYVELMNKDCKNVEFSRGQLAILYKLLRDKKLNKTIKFKYYDAEKYK